MEEHTHTHRRLNIVKLICFSGMQVFLLLGSNIGDRVSILAEARKLLQTQVAPLQHLSQLYESAPWGYTAQPSFLNQAIALATTYVPEAVLEICLKIEHQLGRVRGQRYAPRNIDIDILYYGQHIMETLTLSLPHPGIAHRRFTLLPMVEIAPDWLHPSLGKTQLELLATCTDNLSVHPFVPKNHQ